MTSPKSLVTATEWGVSYTTGSGIAGAVLNVHRCDEQATNAWGGKGVVIRHPEYDGLDFNTTHEAAEFAEEVGLLKVYVPRSAR